MPIQDLSSKLVVTVDKNDTVADAARKMKDQHVGAVLVVERHKIVGILTDRDIVLKAVAENRPLSTRVFEIMSQDVLHVPKGTGVAEVIDKMAKREVRRAVVVDKEHRPCGIISTDDLIQLLGSELHSLGKLVGSQLSNEGWAKAV
jgi:CBS domain-containing protein